MDYSDYRNPTFDPSAWSERLKGLLRDLVIQTSGSSWSISKADLEVLERVEAESMAALSTYFQRLSELARSRCINLSRYESVETVSLGFDCLGRTIPTRWGLKKPRCLGERSGPFDLAVHTPEVVTQLLLTDFDGYMNPANLRYCPTLGYCVDDQLRISYNHEQGPLFAESGFSKLIDVYARRVQGFRLALQSSRPLILVAHSPPTMGVYQKQIDGLMEAFRFVALRRDAPTELLMIKTFEPSSPPSSISPFSENGFAYVSMCLPREGYVWYEPECFLSDAGFEWEKSIVNCIEDVILRFL